jgi:hypothetical protein
MNPISAGYGQEYTPGPDPSVAAILQEAPGTAECVPVDIVNIPDVRILPAKRSRQRNFTLTGPGIANVIGPVIDPDPRYKQVWIVVTGNPVFLGFEEEIKAPNGPFGFPVPVGIALPWEGFDRPYWAVATIGAAGLALRYELWAD